MDAHVKPQPLFDRKRLRAVMAYERHGAAVLARHMVLQAAGLPEAHAALVAAERPFVRMDAHMLSQIVAVRKGLGTDGAHMVAAAALSSVVRRFRRRGGLLFARILRRQMFCVCRSCCG